jgi:hypothetical protein
MVGGFRTRSASSKGQSTLRISQSSVLLSMGRDPTIIALAWRIPAYMMRSTDYMLQSTNGGSNKAVWKAKWSVPQPRTCYLVRPVGRRRRQETIPGWMTMRHCSRVLMTKPTDCCPVWDRRKPPTLTRRITAGRGASTCGSLHLSVRVSTPSHVSNQSSRNSKGSKGH